MQYRKIQRYILIVLGSIVVLALLTVPSYMFYLSVKTMLVGEAKKEASSVAISIAAFLSYDSDNYKKLIDVKDYEAGSYDHDYYMEMLSIFKGIRESINADYVYTEMPISDTEAVYILDGEPMTSEDFSPIGSVDALQEEETQVIESGVPMATDLLSDPVWGTFITGFAPIKHKDTGEFLGLVGVDYSAEYINTLLLRLARILVVIQLIVTILLLIVVAAFIDHRNRHINVDYLTGLKTKRNFEAVLKDLMSNSAATKHPFSIMMMDIDNFKTINDEHGHLIGDSALKIVAQVIHSNTRNGDFGFRFGGDEFAVLLPNTNAARAAEVAVRIMRRWQNEAIMVNNQPIKLTVSMGIAQWEPGKTAAEIVDAADEALYESKRLGKNHVSVAGGGSHPIAERSES